jgi:hypothetical protein
LTTRESPSIVLTKNKKRKVDQDNNVAGLVEHVNCLMTMLMDSQEAVKVAKKDHKLAAIERRDSNTKNAKRESFSMWMTIAKALGKKDELEEVMDEVKRDLF